MMFKRMLDSTVDESSANQEIRKSDTTIHMQNLEACT